MGGSCCGGRDGTFVVGSDAPMCPLASEVQDTSDCHVLCGAGGEGRYTLATRNFDEGEVVFQENPLLLVYTQLDPKWRAGMRAELLDLSRDCAWQYCMAVHCLSADDLPDPLPEGLEPLGDDALAKMRQLCGGDLADDGAPSELARTTVRHLVAASPGWDPPTGVLELGRKIDCLSALLSRNVFEIVDLSMRPPMGANALFYRVSFLNHGCAGMNSATWTWDATERCLVVKTRTVVAAGEELTISYIAQPWSHMATQARIRYLKQNYNFDCICRACTMPEEADSTRIVEYARMEVKPGTAPADQGSRLGKLLCRWMRDEGHAFAAEGGTGQAVCMDEESPEPHRAIPVVMPASGRRNGPLTEEDRVARILERCKGEGFDVNVEEALAALREDEGHVGKTMIKLRHRHR